MEMMRDMNRRGLVTDEYMEELEKAHKRNSSLEAFREFVDGMMDGPGDAPFREFVDGMMDGPGDAPFRKSGGNKKRRKVAERIAKRRAQKAARRRARA